jgi:uncharacterized protein with beta-barrel porin domain
MPLGQSTIAAIVGGELAGLAVYLYEENTGKQVSRTTKRMIKAGTAFVTGEATAALTIDTPGAVGTLAVSGTYMVSDASLASSLIGEVGDFGEGSSSQPA